MKMTTAYAVAAPGRDVIGIMCAGAVTLWMGSGAPCKAGEDSWEPL